MASNLKNEIVIFFSYILIIFHCVQLTRTSDTFREELYIKPLSSGHVYSYFQFTTILNADAQTNPCKLI